MSDKAKRHPELAGLFTLLLSLLFLLSMVSFEQGDRAANWLGLVGYATGFLGTYSFGLGAYLLFGYGVWWGWRLLTNKTPARWRLELIAFSVFLVSLCFLLSVVAECFPSIGSFLSGITYTESVTFTRPIAIREIRHNLGGVPFYYLYTDLPGANLRRLLSNVGMTLVFLATAATSVLVITQFRLLPALMKLKAAKKEKKPPKEKKAPKLKVKVHAPEPQPVIHQEPASMAKKTPPPPVESVESIEEHLKGYRLPDPKGLTDVQRIDLSSIKKDLQIQAQILEETLDTFGIEASVGEINVGPTIASFEVHPAQGVKVQKITALANDLALNLKARSIRIIAPIPGKAAVGIEVPNPKPQMVSLKEMIAAYHESGKKLEIPLLLGKAVNGSPLITDLTKMPHMIIAGATGSGKSVCINTIIMSILMTARPDEVRLLLVDPKKVELTPYTNLPHMIAPVITQPNEAVTALNWLVKEMEKRYQTLQDVGVRNIVSYNETGPEEKMGYIVTIVDELADLMMASSSDVETPITRLAQMARAVGIHLILTTQRPSREVITGLIKANFPVRIAFAVSNRINSQIILDDTGAETLLGNGDMLMLPPGTGHLVRAQGAYVSDRDINKTIDEISRQAPPCYMIKSFQAQEAMQLAAGGGEKDSLYADALELVLAAKIASTTYLQRKLKIGYARAAGIMDQLEDNGVIGPPDGSKPRKVIDAE